MSTTVILVLALVAALGAAVYFFLRSQTMANARDRIQAALTATTASLVTERANTTTLKGQLTDAQSDASNMRTFNKTLQERIDQLNDIINSWDDVAEQAEGVQSAAADQVEASKPADPEPADPPADGAIPPVDPVAQAGTTQQ